MSLPELDDCPRIGLGTWENSDPDQCEETVRNALKIGYRHIDTAQLYENETAVGNGINSSSVDRDEIFLATKVSFENLEHDQVISSTKQSLNELGTDYVDLLYVHWPAKYYEASKTLEAFRKLQDDDLIRYIGLSNFTPTLLDEARTVLDDNIYAHQVEMHPYLKQKHLHDDALKNDLKLVAYSPFRHGTIFDDTTVKEIAEDIGATPAQVLLAWLVQKESVYPIPKATGQKHLEQNFEAQNVSLSDDQRTRIESIERVDRYIDPPFAPDWES
jgi:diketogulonate reductase-like aldo/keto reductase